MNKITNILADVALIILTISMFLTVGALIYGVVKVTPNEHVVCARCPSSELSLAEANESVYYTTDDADDSIMFIAYKLRQERGFFTYDHVSIDAVIDYFRIPKRIRLYGYEHENAFFSGFYVDVKASDY